MVSDFEIPNMSPLYNITLILILRSGAAFGKNEVSAHFS